MACGLAFTDDFSPLMFYGLLYFLAFVAFLITLVFLARHPRREEKRPTPVSQASPPVEKATASSESLTLNVPTKYQHSITVPNLQSAQILMELLKNQGIESTLQVKGEDIKLQFTASQKLRNVSELKKKGIIKDATITEAL